jgi:hypothetical protein
MDSGPAAGRRPRPRGRGGKRGDGWDKAAKVEQLPALRAAAASYVGPDSKEWEIGKRFCLW